MGKSFHIHLKNLYCEKLHAENCTDANTAIIMVQRYKPYADIGNFCNLIY